MKAPAIFLAVALLGGTAQAQQKLDPRLTEAALAAVQADAQSERAWKALFQSQTKILQDDLETEKAKREAIEQYWKEYLGK